MGKSWTDDSEGSRESGSPLSIRGAVRRTTCANGHEIGLLSWNRKPPARCPVSGCRADLDWSPTRGLIPFKKAGER